MAKKIKTLRNLEKDLIETPVRDSQPLIILDTGGLIDMVESARNSSIGKSPEIDPVYRSPASFFQYICYGRHRNGNLNPIVLVTPRTLEEIRRHKGVKINSHDYEISESEFKFAHDACERLKRITEIVNPYTDFDEVGLRIWLMSKGIYQNRCKKAEEGFSDVDREILTYAAYLTSSTLGKNRIMPVHVISSDDHILRGAKQLEACGYFGAYPINTRNGS